MSSVLTRRRALLGTATLSLTSGLSGLLMPNSAFACHDYRGPSGKGCGAYRRDQSSGSSSNKTSNNTASTQQAASPSSSNSREPRVNGRTVRVSNGPQLQQALGSVGPGTTIECANGDYRGRFRITTNGTSRNKIMITSRRRLGAVLRDKLEVRGDHVIVSGLSFNGVGVELRAHNCRVTRCYFTGAGVPISIRGAGDAEIDRNEITRWRSRGIHFSPIFERRTGLKPHIYRNYFHSSRGNNRNDGIIIGDNGSHHGINVGALVEYNLFENIQDAKTFSTKSSGNTMRYNTMINCQGITNRWGVANRYTGNWLERCESFRITDERVVVEGNKLVNCRLGMQVLAGDGSSKQAPQNGGYPFSDSCQLIDNDAGRITVGVTYRSFKRVFPAVNTVLSGNSGEVRRSSERNTRITSTNQSRAGRLAVKLRPNQVGPSS